MIFLYGRAVGQLTQPQWQAVLEDVRRSQDALFIADTDSDTTPPPAADGLHVYNPAERVSSNQDMTAFYRNYVADARAQGKIAALTVIPGYDDTQERIPGFAVPRRDGALYEELWQAAIAAQPDWVLVTSWNEWHEGSEIEPSVEEESLYLQLTRQWAARFKSSP